MNHDQVINYIATGITIIICLSPFVLLGTLSYWGGRMWRRRRQRSQLPTSAALDVQPALKHYTLLPNSAPTEQRETANASPPPTPIRASAGVRPVKLTRQQKAAIIRQARFDYEQARGHAHHQILEQARKQLQKQLEQTREKLKHTNQKVRALEEQRQLELMQQLEYHLIHDRLDEVAGIGSALKHRILTTIHVRRLSDLQHAHSVSGVGQNRQLEINRWIRQYTQRLPQMVNESFPGRERVMQKFDGQIAEMQRTIEQQRVQQTALEQKLGFIEPHYAWLHAIHPETFEKAALGLTADMSEIARYTIGIFAEWETIPDWFKEIMNEEIA